MPNTQDDAPDEKWKKDKRMTIFIIVPTLLVCQTSGTLYFIFSIIFHTLQEKQLYAKAWYAKETTANKNILYKMQKKMSNEFMSA